MLETSEQSEVFIPDENDWYDAKVLFTDQVKGFLLLILSNGQTVYAAWQKVTKSPGLHSLCIPGTTECSVRMRLDHGKLFALEVEFEGDEPFNTSRAVVTKWNGSAGSLYRECGCRSIFAIADSTLDPTTINIGDRVEIVHRPSKKRGWIAVILKVVGK